MAVLPSVAAAPDRAGTTDSTSDKVLIASTADPDGNAITLVEQR
jgi:hypothetical protein